MNQSYARVNANTLLLQILSIVSSDWLQHARSVGGVYELKY